MEPLKVTPDAAPVPELLKITELATEPLDTVAHTKVEPFHSRYVLAVLGWTIKDVEPVPFCTAIALAAPPAMLVADVAVVAVVAEVATAAVDADVAVAELPEIEIPQVPEALAPVELGAPIVL